jgi:ribosomal protein L11 methyltransferase
VKHEQMLDVGTGTGILAMAGALLGAGQVTAIDNDPDAVAVARENVLLNNLADLVTINDQELSTLPQRFDLIIANITHDTLIDMAPLLTERLTRGGALILAGILRGEQEDNIRRTYEKSGLVTMTTRTGDEWAAFYFRKLEG